MTVSSPIVGLDIALLPFNATGAFAARDLADRFAEVINLRDAGAAGDGITDDTAAWNRAMTTACALGLTLYVPPGKYLIDGGNVLSGVPIVGSNRRTTKLLRKPNGTLGYILQATSQSGFSIAGITIDGNKVNQTVDANNLQIASCSDFSVENCAFKNAKGATGAGCGVLLFNTTDNDTMTMSGVRNCVVQNNDKDGVYVSGTCQGLAVNDNIINGNQHGIYFINFVFPPVADTLVDVQVCRNRVTSNALSGVAVVGFATGGTSMSPIAGPDMSPGRRFIISHNIARFNLQYGIAYQGRDGVIDSNICSNSGGTGATYAGILANASDTVISNNICNDNEYFGIDAGGSYRTYVSFNQCRRNGANSVSTSGVGINLGACVIVTANDNECENNGTSSNGVGIMCTRIDGTGLGVVFEWEATNIRLLRNTVIVTSTSQQAISVLGEVKKLEVVDNKCIGVTQVSQFVIESSDAYIRGNHGDETLATPGGVASGSSAFITMPDWVDTFTVTTVSNPTLIGLSSRTYQTYSGGVYYIKVNGATGWTVAPTVSFSGGGGSGATATAYVGTGGGLWIVTNNPGSGYSSAPTVTLTGGNGTSTSISVTIGCNTSLSGRQVTVLFTGPLTINQSAVTNLAGSANITTTGRSVLLLQGFANTGILYQVSLTQGMT